MELSVLRSKTLLAAPIRPTATWETRPITSSGNSARITLRKITTISTRIRPNVAIPTIAWALDDASCESSAWAAAPVTPTVRSEPSTAACASARSFLAASIASGS